MARLRGSTVGCPGEAPTLPRPTERQVQRAVRELYELHGCAVYDLSQPRATMQTPGLPDLWVVWESSGAAWWHEVKRPGGKASISQLAFARGCRATGTGYVIGGVEVAAMKLRGVREMARAREARGIVTHLNHG